MPISRSADSSESEPWTMLKVTSSAKSPRIEPGAASTGIGRADELARRRNGFLAFKHGGYERAARDELDELAEERLLGVLGVVLVCGRLVGGDELQRLDSKAFALEAGEDLAREGALESVGLDEDQGSGHAKTRFLFSKVDVGRRGAGPENLEGASCRSALRAAAAARSSCAKPTGGAPPSGCSKTRASPDAAWPWPSPRARLALSDAERETGRVARVGRDAVRLPLRVGEGSGSARRVGVSQYGQRLQRGIDRLAARLAWILDARSAVGAAQVGALDRVLAVRAGVLLELPYAKLRGADLEFSLAAVLQELRRAENRVDDHAYEGEKRRNGGATHEDGILETALGVEVRIGDESQVDDHQKQDQEVDRQVDTVVLDAENRQGEGHENRGVYFSISRAKPLRASMQARSLRGRGARTDSRGRRRPG